MKWPVTAVVVLVVLAIAGGAWSRFSSGVAVDAVRVEVGPVSAYVEERAKTRLRQTYPITMPYAARIAAIDLQEGDHVKQGQVVARIVQPDRKLARDRAAAQVSRLDAQIAENDDTSVEQVTLKQARSFALAVRESVKAAAARVTSGQEKFQYAVKSRQRIQRLARTGAKTEDDLDKARRDEVVSDVDYQEDNLVHSAMVALQVATDLLPAVVEKTIDRKRLHHAVLAKQRDDAELARQQATLDFQRATMRSPVDGVVLTRPVRHERFLPAGTVLMEIGELDDLEVVAEILSQEVVDVQSGAAVEIFGPAIGHDRIVGHVARIYPSGFTKISSLGVEQQRVLVIIRFAEKDLARLLKRRHLGVGYRVRVRIQTGTAERARRIPRSALFRDADGRWQVFAIDGNVATIRTVQVGLINDDLAAVTGGLDADSLVVVAPPAGLTNGARVRATVLAAPNMPPGHLAGTKYTGG